MPWVRFVDDFDFRPHRKVIVAFKRGMVKLVTTPCAAEGIAKGKAQACKRPLMMSKTAGRNGGR